MPTTHYKEPRECACGFKTLNMSSFSTHKKACRLVTTDKDARIASLESQLAAKDRQIDELIKAAKKPRTVNNSTTNKYVVHQHVNCFGNESVAHITGQDMQKLMADPTNAVPQYIKLKHMRAPVG